MLLIAAIIIMSIIPSLFSKNWIIDILSHFKLQYCILLLIILIINLIYSISRFLNIVIGLCLIWNSLFIVPLFIKSNETLSQSDIILTISCINLLSSNSEYEMVTAYVKRKNPDILVLLEVTPKWEQEIEELFLSYTHRAVLPRNDNFGIAILSKYEIETSAEILNDLDIPSILGQLRLGNNQLTILATHPVPPIGESYFNSRNAQLKSIAEIRHKYSGNFMVIGDLNTSSYSKHFRKFSRSSGLQDSRKGFGILSTWPASFKPMQVTLDHCLVGGDIKVLKRETGDNIGSDHLPLYVELGI